MPARHHRPAIGLIIGTGEGWALYAERLADEMGLYSTPLDRLGMLASDSLRACRLVVDTGLHALGWSRRQAIEYMVRNSPLREGPRWRRTRPRRYRFLDHGTGGAAGEPRHGEPPRAGATPGRLVVRPDR
jgi:hypothetical protein